MERAAGAAEGTTIDPAEIARFTAMAEDWWDPNGKFRPLHKFNPVRLGFLRDRFAAHFGRDARALRPFEGLRLLDIGCGGGLIAEPMARLGFAVTGIDASPETIMTARTHAEQTGLVINYRVMAIEDLVAAGAQYDAVLALEVVEHVADPGAFFAGAANVLKPAGALAAATLNRTTKSWLFAVVGAEYVLRWLPRGTHDWEKFLRPSEFAGALRRAGIVTTQMTGLAYNPLTGAWALNPTDLDVNYMVFGIKP